MINKNSVKSSFPKINHVMLHLVEAIIALNWYDAIMEIAWGNGFTNKLYEKLYTFVVPQQTCKICPQSSVYQDFLKAKIL